MALAREMPPCHRRPIAGHLRGLGQRRDREGPGKDGGQQGGGAGDRVHDGKDATAQADELDDGPRSALLCLDGEPAACHRRVLTEALSERRPALVVIDL